MSDLTHLQAELLVPAELRAALARRSLVYLPLGTYEYHAEHLPIGLDALTAHGICLRAAEQDGGVVFPPLHYGTGGGHASYPWTIVMPDDTQIRGLLERSLQRLQQFGVEEAVLFTGHFAGEQVAMVEDIAADWTAQGNALRVVGLAVNLPAATPVEPDHAGVFETSLLAAMWPGRVRLDLLPDPGEAPSLDPGGDERGAHRHDPAHPLHGVFGPDPRRMDLTTVQPLLEAVVNAVVARVQAHTHHGRERDLR